MNGTRTGFMNTQNSYEKLAYGINDAVQATSVGRTFLYGEIKAGRLKTFKVGTRTLIKSEDLDAWLSKYGEAAQ
jgi:excisionase family DNA binding protein